MSIGQLPGRPPQEQGSPPRPEMHADDVCVFLRVDDERPTVERLHRRSPVAACAAVYVGMPGPDAPLRALTCNAPVVEMRAGGYDHGPEGLPWTRGGWARWLNAPARTPKLAEEDGSRRGDCSRLWLARGSRR